MLVEEIAELEFTFLAIIFSGRDLESMSILCSKDFTIERHGHMFNAVKRLIAEDIEISLISIWRKLGNEGTLLKRLTHIMCFPIASHSGFELANALRDEKLKRDFQEILKKHHEKTNDSRLSSQAHLEDLKKSIEDFEVENDCKSISSELTAFQDLSTDFKVTLEERAEMCKSGTPVCGIPTGFGELDKILLGFSPAHLLILASRPAVGKTTLMLNFVEHLAFQKNIPVGIFSLEMSKTDLFERLLSSFCKIPLISIRSGDMTTEEKSRISLVTDRLKLSATPPPVIIDDKSNHTLASIEATAILMKKTHKIQVLFIDYLQLIGSENLNASIYQKVSEISRQLKCLAKKINLPVICLSQLSRLIEAREDGLPMLSDLRDSGSIEQDADIVFCLYNGKSENQVYLKVLKNRHGALGSIQMNFQKNICKFVEMIKTY